MHFEGLIRYPMAAPERQWPKCSEVCVMFKLGVLLCGVLSVVLAVVS